MEHHQGLEAGRTSDRHERSNAYHEMVEYPDMLARIRASLREGGRLVILDNHPSGEGRDRASQTARHNLAMGFAEDELGAAGFDVVRREPSFIDEDHGGHRHRMLVGVRPERDPTVRRLAGAPEGAVGSFWCAFPGTREELLDRPSPPDSADLRLGSDRRSRTTPPARRTSTRCGRWGTASSADVSLQRERGQRRSRLETPAPR
jgi:hypothetical protein